MQIYLLRHGIAEDPKPRQSDADRSLTEEGREKLRRILKRARAADVVPSLIVSSPLKRAVQTAEEAAAALGYQDKILTARALVPEASPRDVWDEIRVHRQEPAILLSSHEPLMSATMAYLLRSPALTVDFKKGAIVRIDCEGFGPEPAGCLKWMLTAALA